MDAENLLRYDFMRHALISGLLLGPTCATLGVTLGFIIDSWTGWTLEPSIYVLIPRHGLIIPPEMAYLTRTITT